MPHRRQIATTLLLFFSLGISLCLLGFPKSANWNRNIAYAADETCKACKTTSPDLILYEEFVNEMIKTMETFANELVTSSSSEQSATNIFTDTKASRVGNTEAYRGVASITDTINQSSQEAVTAGYVALLIGAEGVMDSIRSIGPLMNNESVLRDRNKINTLDQKIMSTLINLGNRGVFIKRGFKKGRNQRINESIKSYSESSETPNGLFTVIDKRVFPSGDEKTIPSYQGFEVMSALWAMNQAIKNVLSATASRDGTLDSPFFNGKVAFSDNFKKNLLEYYFCARGVRGMVACTDAGKTIKKETTAIIDKTQSDGKAAKKIVTDAIERLKGMFSKTDKTARDAFLERRTELLTAQYGWKSSHDSWKDITKGLLSSFKTATATIKKDITETSSSFLGIVQTFKAPPRPTSVEDIQSMVLLQNSRSLLRETAVDTQRAADKARKETVYVSIEPITKLFPQVTQELILSRFSVDGQNQKKSIVQSLGNACENQCKNVGGICWYPEEGK